MTYKCSYDYKKYEFTAFTEADFLGQGGNGSSIGCGDSFTMPGSASVCLSTWDNDGSLSGDTCRDDQANDSSGQKAIVDGERVGSQMYAESYHVLKGSDGKTYYMIEIEIECHDAPGAGDDYFTFYGAVPPAGVELSVVKTCNVKGNWVDFKCLGAGEKAPANEAPTFTNIPADGIFCVDENQTFVIDLAATDADGDTLTYEIVGGADASAFTIDPETGELTFVAAPDYEAPTDGNGNNVYDVTVKVSDGKGGEEIKPLWIKVKDVEEATQGGTCIVVEAEDMQLCGYRIENNDSASGDKVIKGSACDWASAKTVFDGPEGTYDLKLSVLDETDGQGRIVVMVNGCWVLDTRLDLDNGGNGCEPGEFRVLEINDIDLKSGDVVKIWGLGNRGEYARIDKLEFCSEGSDPMTAEIGDTIWFDTDKDGIQDADELGAAGVTVLLKDATGNTIDQTTTDDAGNYSFSGLAAGDYTVTVVAPGAYGFSAQGAGNDATADSDVDATGSTGVITLAAGESNLDVDAGLVDPGTGVIEGRVFCDENGNDLNDENTPVDNVVVTLLNAAGVVVLTTTTAPDGSYSFTGLDAGDYTVNFAPTAPEDVKTFVGQDAGSDDSIDSDVDAAGTTAVITLGVGETVSNVDAGIEDPATASIEGRVFCDENDNDVDDAETGVIGVRVELLDATGAVLFTTLTKADGVYSFQGLEAGDYSVRFDESTAGGKTLVAQDAGNDDTIDSDADASGVTGVITLGMGAAVTDVDAGVELPLGSLSGTYFDDANNDGLNNDATPVEGVLVELLDANGAPTGATATTDALGNYSFGDLAPGTYGVKFTDTVTGKTLVAANVGNDDSIDSDAADLGNGMSQITDVVVVGGQDTPNNDAGVADPATASISGRYFCDDNNDGVDNDEPGIADTRVVLINQAGQSIATTTTAADGSYSFEGLTAGKYSVRFIAEANGKTFIVANVGDDDTIDSDVITVGNASGNGTTGKVTLSIGEAVTDLDAGVETLNAAPVLQDDTAKFCADKTPAIDVLGNDLDTDGGILSVLSIADADELAFVGESLTLDSGAIATLNADGTVSYDANGAHDALLVGQMAVEESISYTVSDGQGGTGTANLDITVCGTVSTLQMICDSLPDQVQLNIGFDFDSVNYQINVADDAGTTADDGLASSTWTGLCIDIVGELMLDTDLMVNVYGPCETLPTDVLAFPENLDLISWILNEEFVGRTKVGGNGTYDIYDVQEAVWALSDGTVTSNSDANDLVMMAEMQGEGFVAQEGDLVAVIFDPIAPDASVTNTQTFIMGVEWDALALDCIC